MTPITKIKYLGKVSAYQLAKIGIHSKEDIEKIGIAEVYKALKASYPKLSLNMLWAIEAGMAGVNIFKISKKRKKELLKMVGEGDFKT